MINKINNKKIMRKIKRIRLKEKNTGKLLYIEYADSPYYSLEDPETCDDDILVGTLLNEDMVDYLTGCEIYDEKTLEVINVDDLEKIDVEISIPL